MTAKWHPLYLLLAAFVAFGLLLRFYGYENTWRLWKIEPMTPHFADLRVITAGCESRAQGFDPLIENPADHWQRSLNYPRIWQCLYHFGVNQSHTTWIGLGVILSFLAGVCFLARNVPNLHAAIIVLAVLSPATLLGIERCNTDLLMFALMALSLAALSRTHGIDVGSPPVGSPLLQVLPNGRIGGPPPGMNRGPDTSLRQRLRLGTARSGPTLESASVTVFHVLAAAVLYLAFLLKLYPIFALPVFLSRPRASFLRTAAILIALALAYGLFTWSDLRLIRDATQRCTDISYGIDVFWMWMMNQRPILGFPAFFVSYAAVLAALLFACRGLSSDSPPGPLPASRHLDAFRVGASIYVGTFLLGTNFEYRLIFLIFALPQLLAWRSSASPCLSRVSLATLIGIFIAMWHMVVAVLIWRCLPYGDYVSNVIDQAAKWTVFGGLLCLIVQSMPDWVRQAMRGGFAKVQV